MQASVISLYTEIHEDHNNLTAFIQKVWSKVIKAWELFKGKVFC